MVSTGMHSHVIMFSRLGTLLIQHGHDISMVIPSNANNSDINPDIDLHVHPSVGNTNIMSSSLLVEMILEVKYATSTREYFENIFKMLSIVKPVIEEDCRMLLDDEDLRDKLVDREFDFAIVDNIGMPCSMNYPVTLGLDSLMFSIPSLSWFSRVPDWPSFSPEQYAAKHTDKMTFLERFENTLNHLMVHAMFNTTNAIDMTKYHPGRPIPDMRELQRRALFWFWLDDPALSYPRPHMPNTVSVGDFMVREEQTLPNEFQQFLDEAPDGAILLSFGSYIDKIPTETAEILCGAFSRISQKIIWKTSFQPPCAEELRNKIMVVNWMPQNDILAHPNLTLFITHCGLNSMLESLYHAKPMIGFPIFFDQPYNAKLLEAKNYGIVMDLAHFTSDELIRNINNIILNEEVERSIHFGSRLIRDKPQRPGERISYWMDHVAKYGADHLRTGAYKLSVFEFLLLDVLLTGVIIVIVIVIVFLCLVCCVYRCFKNCCFASKRGEKDKTE